MIVERPRAKALRDIYKASWGALSALAENADCLIADLEFLANQKESQPITKEYVSMVLGHIRTGDLLYTKDHNARELFLTYIDSRASAKSCVREVDAR